MMKIWQCFLHHVAKLCNFVIRNRKKTVFFYECITCSAD